MREFKKFDLTPPVSLNSTEPDVPTQNSMNKSMQFLKKRLGIGAIVLVVLGSGLLFGVVLPAQKAISSARSTYAQAKLALDAAKKQNIVVADEELKKTKTALLKTQKDLHAFSYAGYIPLVGGYYNDADHGVNAGLYGIDAGLVLIDSIKPYADVLGLKGQGSFVMGSAENRIQTAILTMGKITPRIDEIATLVQKAQKEIDQINPNHYPSILGGGKIATQIKSAQTLIDGGVTFVNEARPLVKVLPTLLGEKSEKKYLILFQNDKELRPTGGFITAYAVFTVDRGNIKVERSDDIYNLDRSLSVKTKPPSSILKYLPTVTSFNLRDSNLSPDFLESMKTFNSLYDNVSGKAKVDGIIALDTHVLAAIIKILDDEVFAGGVKFTSKNDPRCDCPQVVFELERITDTPKSLDLRINKLADVQAVRKDIIGVLLSSIMQKALKSSPKLYWGPLMQQLIAETSQKHVLFYLYDKDAQQGVEALNAGGRIKAFEGNYLHINDANLGGAKSNMFVKQSVVVSVEKASDGTITNTVAVAYKNPFKPSNCNLESGGLCLNATLRDWVRVYTPKGSQLVKSQGSEVKVTSYEDLGKTAFDGFITVKPLGSTVYTVSYTLPFKLTKNSPLPLLIQKQPGTDGTEYTIKVQGKEVKKFVLERDTEIQLSL